MDTSKIHIGEIFVRVKENGEIIEKRIGYNAMFFIKEYNSYITLGRHEEIYPEATGIPINYRYVKKNTLIPYLSFGTKDATNEEIINSLKNKIQELIDKYNKEKLLKEENLDDKKVKKQKRLKWEYKYELARSYYEHYGHLKVPQNFKTINGYDYDESGESLGLWIMTQRLFFKNGKLTDERKKQLDKIGMLYEVSVEVKFDDKWLYNLELLKKYKEHYNSLNIPILFKTFDGYIYDEEGFCLGQWLINQRFLYRNGRLPKNRINLLESIGINFKHDKEYKEEEQWEQKYKLACAYYEHYGNLNVKESFKTSNGVDYDPNGIALGSWIACKRQLYKGQQNYDISFERIKQLEKIGMIWFKETYDKKSQREIITNKNKVAKQKELTNRFISTLCNYDDSSLPPKEELNKEFIRRLK